MIAVIKKNPTDLRCRSVNLDRKIWHPFRPCNQYAVRLKLIPLTDKHNGKVFGQALHCHFDPTSLHVGGVNHPTFRLRPTLDNRSTTCSSSQFFGKFPCRSKARHLATDTFTSIRARVLQFKNNLFHVENSRSMLRSTAGVFPYSSAKHRTNFSDWRDFAYRADTLGHDNFSTKGCA